MRFPAVAKRLLPEFSPDANDALADVSLARDWRAHDFPPAPRARAASHEPGREALGVEQMRAPRHAREVRLPRGEVAQAHRALTGASGGAVEREGGARERSDGARGEAATVPRPGASARDLRMRGGCAWRGGCEGVVDRREEVPLGRGRVCVLRRPSARGK